MMAHDAQPSDHEPRPTRAVARWLRRFADAFHGIAIGVRTQESLHVHLVVTALVLALAAFLDLEAWQWCLLLLCITTVIALELMNSAIERLVKTLHPEHDQGLAETLHLAASSVLVGAVGSVVIGIIILVPPVWQFLSQHFD
jgi:diacylglycerol kinase